MATRLARPVPAWFWGIAVLAVLWEGYGCYVYLSQSLLDQSARTGGYAQMSAWQWGVFAVAVWSGLLGAVALLLRSRWAVTLLGVSLIATIVSYGYNLTQGLIAADERPLAIVINVAGFALLLFAGMARKRGWLR